MSRGWTVSLCVVSVALAGAVLAGIMRETRRPWRQIQADRSTAGSAPVEIVEILAPGGPERCLTCHRDQLDGTAESHPDVMVAHPPLRFGCVACHGGDARALDPSRAHTRTGRDRLVESPWRGAMCAHCHTPGAVADGGAVVTGILAFDELGCGVCHRAAGLIAAADLQGGFGPDLDDAGRLLPATLLEMLRDPPGTFGPDTEMPPFAATLDARPELQGPLLSYLQTLRLDRPLAVASGDAQQPCVGCHSAARPTGLTEHRCPIVNARAPHLSCARCHAAGTFVNAAPRRDLRCLFVDGQRSICAACHRSTFAPVGGSPHER